MKRPGTQDRPLRVAIIGSGPAGFYVAQHLFAKLDDGVSIDMFDRLPTPFGLVRFGVAPDHPKIKAVTAVYEKIAARTSFRFFGDVEFGADLTLADLQRHYHQVVFCTGAQTDRRLGIDGEDLQGSHPATEFVAWYNGHPDYADYSYDLSGDTAVVIGVGNVAADVARILCRSTAELAQTDIADHALEVLGKSGIRRVLLIGRRGPAQAAFSNPEIKEMGEIDGTVTSVLEAEAALDPLSAAAVEADGDKATARKLELFQSFVGRQPADGDRSLEIRFLLSPVSIEDDGNGRVGAVQLVKNRLVDRGGGRLSAEATEEIERVPAQLVFRSIGYRGVPLPDLPFREDWGIIPNEVGRMLQDGQPLTGLYVSGWIKRGPSGVIGTNKPCALETVESMLADLEADRALQPTAETPDAIDALLAERGIRPVRYADWQQIDAAEREAGERSGRPRVKLIERRDVRALLDR